MGKPPKVVTSLALQKKPGNTSVAHFQKWQECASKTNLAKMPVSTRKHWSFQ
jgi:hypothetical protein